MKKTELKNKIETQENKDLEKLKQLFDLILSGGTYSLSGMPFGYQWDAEMSYSANNKVYFYEIELKAHPKNSMNSCIIKKEKLERMLKYSKAPLLYIQFFKDCTVIHNLKRIPKDKMRLRQIPLKKTEMDDDSEIEIQDVYFFPFNTYDRLYDNLIF